MSSSLRIQKTDFALPVIHLLNYDIDKLNKELKKFILSNSDEDSAIPCVLSIEQEFSNPTFLAQALECFRQHGILPIGLKTELDSVIEHANYAGLAVFSEKLNQLDLFESFFSNSLDSDDVFLSTEPPLTKSSSLKAPVIHQGTVTGGEQIYAKNRDLVILGDVQKGAEVIADGNVYIGGSLQGKAYAGNSGMMNIDEISVRAYVFEPELISIAGFYQLYEDVPTRYLGLPVKTKFEMQKFSYQLE